MSVKLNSILNLDETLLVSKIDEIIDNKVKLIAEELKAVTRESVYGQMRNYFEEDELLSDENIFNEDFNLNENVHYYYQTFHSVSHNVPADVHNHISKYIPDLTNVKCFTGRIRIENSCGPGWGNETIYHVTEKLIIDCNIQSSGNSRRINYYNVYEHHLNYNKLSLLKKFKFNDLSSLMNILRYIPTSKLKEKYLEFEATCEEEYDDIEDRKAYLEEQKAIFDVEKQSFEEKVSDYELFLAEKKQLEDEKKKLRLVQLALQNEKRLLDEDKVKFTIEKELLIKQKEEIDASEIDIEAYLTSKLD